MATIETGVETLVRLLKDTNENPLVRIGAAEGLAEIGGSKALSVLQDILIHFSSSAPEVRSAVAIALGKVVGRMQANSTFPCASES